MPMDCQQCGSKATLVEDEHNFEKLLVCSQCGSESTKVLTDLVHDHGFMPIDIRPKTSGFRPNYNRVRLPNQPEGFVETRCSLVRRDLIGVLKSVASKCHISPNSEIFKEAERWVFLILKQGKKFGHRELTAGCLYAGMKNRDSDRKSLLEFSKVVEVPPPRIHKVVTHLTTLAGYKWEDRRDDYDQDPIPGRSSDIFESGTFWDNSGSRFVNEDIKLKTEALLAMFTRLDGSGVRYGNSCVLPTAFLVYKSAHTTLRKRMDLAAFVSECSIPLTNEELSLASKHLSSVSKCLRQLVLKLPFFVSEMHGQKRRLTTDHALPYIDEVLKHQESLLAPRFSPSDDIGVVDDQDLAVDEYIRSEKEVKLLQPVYDKFFRDLAKKPHLNKEHGNPRV
eukprot:maker-scaffold96_size378025-snap-gene-0.24 protein:Tk04961 transcript:maker-scaffold96_size378025-snap-gene-0.24-mRNA-1 annotation:"hypothetical protein BRAFLDRAFT_288911"